MKAITSVSECVKCKGVFEESFRVEAMHYSGLCKRCGYNIYEYPVADQSPQSMLETGVQMELTEYGGYGILSVGGEAFVLEDDNPETLTKAQDVLRAYAEDAATHFFTFRVAGNLVCLEGVMPDSYAAYVLHAHPEFSDPVVAEAEDAGSYPF